MSKAELLLPAGSPDTLNAALRYGADAVYMGGGSLSLRAKADNLEEEELSAALRLTHSLGKKLYLAVNIFAHNEDLPKAEAYFCELARLEDKPDALIISDFGILGLARELCPEIPVHISTQTNSTNYETFRFWYRMGVRRVVCARELSLTEIREIREHVPEDMELECFVHGAMCMSYSGRCLISNYLTGRDANRGACTHPCRWKYALTEETRPGVYMPIEEDDRGSYLYNSKDLCMVEHLPELLDAGVSSLKVEGRMKNALYVATVARAYRLALDMCERDREAYRNHASWFAYEAGKCTSREFTTGFYFGKPGPDSQNYRSADYNRDCLYLGMLEQDEKGLFFRQKNKFCVGDWIEVIRPNGSNSLQKVKSLTSEDGTAQEACPHPLQKLYLETDGQLHEYDILRTMG